MPDKTHDFNDYVGRNRRWIMVALLVGALVVAAVGSWGVTVHDALQAAPLL